MQLRVNTILIHQPDTTRNFVPVSIHSHVQGPVLAEGEASLRLVHLHGGAASIQQDSINAAWLNVHAGQQGFKLTESAKQWFHATAGDRIREHNSMSMHMVEKYINNTNEYK